MIRYPRLVAQVACFLALAALAQTLPPLLPPAANFSFPAKQTLTYAVDWRVFPAGTATFHLEQVGNMQHIIATGESIGAVNLLFASTIALSLTSTAPPVVPPALPSNFRRAGGS